MYAWKFLKEFITSPGAVGAVAPSSRLLATQVTESTRVPNASTVVEFGPGTGAITEVILERLRPDATFFAMEINPDFVNVLRNRFPKATIYHDTAVKTPEYLAKHGLTNCDAIVSGLPWSFFEESLQEDLLNAVVTSLRPGGVFATYMYLQALVMPSGMRFRQKLRDRFSHSGITKVIWKNVPPARVVWAEK